jgi:ferredoxin/flavodoxin---NADP+ reductase
MIMVDAPVNSVAIIGAGPAGLYAAQELVRNGVKVVIFNRDIKPGGLAEYGVYPEKYKLKDGFRAAFAQILENPQVEYYGNVLVRRDGDLTLDEVRAMGFQAVLVTVGAQGTKWLGLQGEGLKGVYHAKDIVYHYNKLPPFSQHEYNFGKRVVIVGVGNVMMDIARYSITILKCDTVTAVARRGPGEVKFDKAELDAVSYNVDIEGLKAEINQLLPSIAGLSENPQKPVELIEAALPKATINDSNTHFSFRFLLSPVRILGDENDNVVGIEFEENRLVKESEDIKAVGTGKKTRMDADTVVFAIGDCVDEKLGLPVRGPEFVKNPEPIFPMDGNSYEVYDPVTCRPLEGVFLGGWARRASTGLVGITRRDGTNGARALLKYLETLGEDKRTISFDAINERLAETGKPIVTKPDLLCLRAVEKEMAAKLGVPDFKFASHEEMLQAIGHCRAGVR